MARKPPGVTFETWVDRQIREGAANGAFDDLPRGPIDLSDQHDADWWIKRKVRDEGIETLPASLVLRREVEQAARDARSAPTEDEARRQIEVVNERIRNANRIAISGPPVNLVTYDVDRFLTAWRTANSTDLDPPDPTEAASGPPARSERERWRWSSWRGRWSAVAGRRGP